ncbi:hypothetical protein MVI27_09830 [Chryseobacterium salipaludis]|uniref:hypothetical protein n=1 Tax=Chryseobacterium TaxID=59732 RepID=UPI001FF4ED97|nr:MULTISPECIES: hypothetical protein [Chryseobacterium]MCJ8498560.1 hypothetical protein [Chryseobacterium salipaludis]MCX3297115.1 hypothetical protein [Planobacterium sp. JC490]
MADNNGGDIRYKIGIDKSELESALRDGEGKLRGFSEVVSRQAGSVDNLMDVTKENLVIQKQVIKDLESEYKQLQKQLDKVAPGNAKAAMMQEAAKIKTEIEGEKNALAELEVYVKSSSAAHDTLRTKLLAVRNEMAQLVANGQKNSAQYNELATKAAEYQRAINAVNADMKSINRSGGLDVLVGGLRAATGAASTFMGVITLLSDKNENLTKIMTNLQGVMAAAIGVEQLHNSVNKEGALIQGIQALQAKAKAKADALAAASTGKATIAQRAFNAVAKANPYVLLAAAIISVVGAIALMTKKSQQAAEDMKAMNKQVADSVAEPMIQYKMLQAQWNALGSDLKAKEKFIKDNKDEFNKLGVEVNNVNDAENVLRDKTAAFEKSMMARAKAAAAMQIASEKYKEYLENFDEHQQREQKYANDGLFGKINKSVNEFGANILGIGPKSTAQMNAMKNGYESMVKVAVKATQEADEAFAKAGFRAPGTTKKEKEKKGPKPKKADEFLPPGSVAEIQKRLSEIDKALSKATGAEQIAALKTKRLAAVKELAAAEAKIRIDSLKEAFDREQSLWADYYAAVESLGKDKADEIYKGLLPDGSMFDNLQKTIAELSGKDSLTDEERTLLGVAIKQSDELLGKESALSQFTKKIAALKKPEELEAERGNLSGDDKSNGYAAAIAEREREILEQRKQDYQAFVKEAESLEQQQTAIAEKYALLRAQIEADASTTAEEKARLSAEAMRRQAEENSKLMMEAFKGSADWSMAFGDMEYISQAALKRIEASLLEFKRTMGETLEPTEMRELEQAINRVQDAQLRNPFKDVISSYHDLKDAVNAVRIATEEYNATLDANGNATDKTAAAAKRLSEAEMEAAAKKKKLTDNLNKSKEIFNAVGEGVMTIGEMFGGFDDAANDAIESIMEVGNAALDLGTSIAKGDIAGMIKAGVQLIGSLWKAINGDKKKERNVKRELQQLAQLTAAYDRLSHAANKALGDKRYSGQTDMIKNLQQQKVALQNAINAEGSKKKADQGKIDEWTRQLQGIDQEIENIKDNIAETILQTTAKDAARELGDALVEAFARGEDAASALEDFTNNLFKRIVKQAVAMKLQPLIDKFLNELMADIGFNENGSGAFTPLTPEQMEFYKNWLKSIGQAGQDLITMLEPMLGGDQAGPINKGMEGAVKSITSQEAGELVAQFNAMRIIQGKMFEIAMSNDNTLRESLMMLAKIEYNTSKLHGIALDISSINSKMSDDGGRRAGGL